MKRILPGILLLLCALAASAQTTQITANQIALFGGAAVTGQFCVSPVDTSGNPINIQVPGGQQLAGTTQLCFPITNGVLSNTAVVPDTSLTQPVNSCYLLKISNNVGQPLATYPCIQPQGATWSFDSYVPSVTATIPTLSLPQFQTNGVANAVQGILNLAGSGVTYSSGGTVTIAGGGGSSGPGTVTTAMLSGVDLFQAMNTLAATLPGGPLDTTQLACGTYTVTHQLTALNLTGKKFVWLKSGCQKIIDNTVFSSSTTASPTYCGIPIGGDGAGGNAIVEVGNNTSNTGDIQAGPSFVGYDLMCNGEWDGSQESAIISGVNLQGNASATIGGSLLHLSHVYSGTTVEKSSTYLCYANCLTVNNSGNVLFQGNQWEDGATTGSYGGAVVNIDSVSSSLGNGPLLFDGDSIQHQGPHNPLIVVNGHGGLQSGAIQFYDSYFEFSAATASTANPDVTPIQVVDSFEVGFHNARIQGLTNNGSTTDQQNAIEITSTGSFKDSFDIEINEMSVLGSMGFTCLVKNNIDNSCQPGFTNGLTGSAQILALPNYLYGQIIPTDTLTNIAAPSGWCTTYTLGSTWTNSTASTNAKLFCKLVSGTPTGVALDATGSYDAAGAATTAVNTALPVNQGFPLLGTSTAGTVAPAKIFFADAFPSSGTVNGVAYTTQADMAFYTAQFWATTNSQSPMLLFGAGTYTTAKSFIFATGLYTPKIYGSGQSSTTLQYTGASHIPVISRATGSTAFMDIHNMTVDGNYVASAEIDLLSLNQTSLSDMTLINNYPNTTYMMRVGSGFQVNASRIQMFENSGSGLGNFNSPTTYAYLTCTPSSGAIANAQCALTSAGTGYPSTAATLTLIFTGFQNGNSYKPCTTMPVGTATVSGTTVASFNITTNGAGCVGTAYAVAAAIFPVTYGFQAQVSDSTFTDITSYVGSSAGIAALSSNDTWIHAHPAFVATGIYSNAANNFIASELDNTFRYGFDFAGPACPGSTLCGVNVTGTMGYMGAKNLQSPATFYFESGAKNVTFSGQASLCGGQQPPGWQEFATQTGTIDSGIGSWPTGVSNVGNDQSCSETVGDYIPNLTVGTIQFAKTGTPTCTVGSGAGTGGASCAITAGSTNGAGEVLVISGTGGTGTNVNVVTINWANGGQTNWPRFCSLSPADYNSGTLGAHINFTSTATTMDIYTGANSMAVSNQHYTWHWGCP